MSSFKCNHRGSILHTDFGNKCPYTNVLFNVFECHLYKECSLLQYHEKIRSCKQCLLNKENTADFIQNDENGV